MNRIKSFSLFAVALMMVSGFVVLAETDDSDATDGVLESLYPGSWTWDSETGIGPFNSFYAAFDMTDGNKLYAILNPYDLKETIDGEILSPLSNYNIMWVLPTVYWKAVGNDVTITNDPTSGGTAYAHTIDGHVYNYVAYGVYHGAKKTIDGVDVLTSESGVAPTVSQTRATFRDQANNYVMDSSLGTDAHSMLWNFYQWTLYKLLCYTVMEDFNSQSTVGNGNVNGGNYTKVSGSLDTYGPYAGNNGDLGSSGTGAATYGKDAAKLFIEEAWGTVLDFVDGVIVNGTSGFYIDTSSVPTDSTTAGGNVEYVTQTLPSTGWQTSPSTNERIWGIGTANNGTWNTGLTDYIYTSTSSNRVLYVGGYSATVASGSVYYGLSSANADIGTSASGTSFGSRLAFVFDAGPAATTGSYTYTLSYDPTLISTTSAAISVAGMDPITHDAPPTYTATIQSSDTSYGTVSSSSITDIEPGTVITTDGNTLTIGSTTITASTVTDPNGQYTRYFDGWYIGSTEIVSGTTTVDSDITITAQFHQAMNAYDITITAGDNGSITPVSELTNIAWGTAIAASGSTLTIGSATITAVPDDPTAQYTYSFSDWSGIPTGGTVTEDVTITANFTATVNTYTITWIIGDTVETETLAYGATPSHAEPEAPEGQVFMGWSPKIVTVTGDATYTATFGEPSDPTHDLLNLVPFFIVIAIVMAAVGGIMMSNGDPMALIKLVIGLAIAIIVLAGLVIPVIGGI